MKLAILIPAIFCCFQLLAQQPKIVYAEESEGFQVRYENPTKELGIGLLKLDYSKQPTVGIYNDSGFTSKYDQWNSKGANMEIYPKFYELDYGICDFVCLEVHENYYKILIGYNQAKYVKVSDSWSLTTWKGLIEGSYGVTRKKDRRESNKLREKADENSKEIYIDLKVHENFCVIALENEWVKVQYDCIYASEKYTNDFEGEPCSNYIQECGSEKIGWLRWQKDGELLVDIYLQP